LAALLGAFPYDVPTWAPEAITHLATFAGNDGASGQVAAAAVAGFKKTHGDEWERHKLAFTDAQTDQLDDAARAGLGYFG